MAIHKDSKTRIRRNIRKKYLKRRANNTKTIKQKLIGKSILIRKF